MSSSTTVFAYVFIIISPSFALSDGPPNGWSPPPPPADNPSPGVPLPSKWVAELFYRALANFTVNEDAATAECRRQTRMYVSQLRNNTYWAVKSKCDGLGLRHWHCAPSAPVVPGAQRPRVPVGYRYVPSSVMDPF